MKQPVNVNLPIHVVMMGVFSGFFMTSEQLNELIALGHEQSGVEFKGHGSRTERPFFAIIALAMLGMSNRRDGGRIIIGVGEDENNRPVRDPLNEHEIETWTYDDLANSIDEYADPSVSFDFKIVEQKFVVITVNEFIDVPVLCKRTYNNILRKGACYVRPRRKPETTEIPSQADMRDLLDLALEKRLRKFLSEATKGGIQFVLTKENDHSDQFLNQLKGFIS